MTDGWTVTEFVKSPARLGQRDRLADQQGPVLSTDAPIQIQQHQGYRPDIDGLRAVAVLMVVLYHFALPAIEVPGGYTGVDVFFVISGYLITRLLMAEPTRPGALRRFYLRRFRRLYPALLAMVTATLVAGYFLMMPGDYLDLGDSARYAIFALGNLHFYGNTGYFDQAAELQPLLHTWSLAVEEQFYLLWPFAIFGAKRLGGPRAALWLCLGVVSAGFAYAAWAVQWEAKLAFYSPLARAWELGLGALMVFAPALPGRRAAGLANGAGIALIAWSAFALSNATVFPGPSALFACAGSALVIWPKAARSWTARALAAAPMRRLGLISYSLYLWHWPVLVFALHDSGGALSSAQGLVLLALVFIMAWSSWRWIEEPFRRRSFAPDMGRLLSMGGVLAPCLMAAVVVLGGGLMHRLAPQAAPMSSLDVMWQWQPQRVVQAPLSGQVAFGAPWNDARYRIVLWGDSHAEHLAPLLEQAVQAHPAEDVSVMLYRSCPAMVDGEQVPMYGEDDLYNARCRSLQRTLWRFLAAADHGVDQIVLASSWRSLLAHMDPALDLTAGLARFEQTLGTAVKDLLERVPQVTVIGQIPGWQHNPVPCVAARSAGLPRYLCPEAAPALELAKLNPYYFRVNQVIGNVTRARPGARMIDPLARWCDTRVCRSVIDGHFLYRDEGHLRRNLPQPVTAQLADELGLKQLLSGMQAAQTGFVAGGAVPHAAN